jgi:putative transposase
VIANIGTIAKSGTAEFQHCFGAYSTYGSSTSLSINIAPKDQREQAKLLGGGVQQVWVVLRAVALLRLAKCASAPQIANLVPLTAQAIRNVGRRYQQGGLERALYERPRLGAAEVLGDRNNV